ncbi:MAG: hypothetical protein P8123_07665 [bacterium]
MGKKYSARKIKPEYYAISAHACLKDMVHTPQAHPFRQGGIGIKKWMILCVAELMGLSDDILSI